MQQRRSFLHASAGLALLGLAGCASTTAIPTKARVVVIGGGYGGATAAKYVRLLSDHRIDVVLIEPNEAFVSCPISNLVIGGSKQIADITTPYTALSRRHGVTVVRDTANAIDTAARTVRLASGATIGYDKLVVSPGVELQFGSIEGLEAAHTSGQILQAWKAGRETVALRRQLEAMPDGGVYAITIPEAPYRCPPGPYERACQVAWYFKNAKPRSKVLILDANPDVTSKGPLFKKVWAEQYKGIVEYRGQHKVTAVDARAGLVKFDVQDDVKAQVINALPAMRAGNIAVQAGLNNMANNRWCGVNYQTFESTAARDVFVIGDAIQIAPAMPKSGHMANGHAKVAAAAIVAQLAGWDVNPAPMLNNTCYSFVDDRNVVHVASVHAYDKADKTFKTVAGSGGVSPGPTELEGVYAMNWAQNIWSDTLG
ncbi:NAD(P)/FAD-dependent oxidoreductase [Pseudorhodoferax sp. Leaf267]|uniref:NAD(P)/FAD-dependent oxidoreductase n=1 Tax=Pseudorhodoferax sp. Leaf267 TaxID=1736316 RepID=UPI0006F28CEB|nr:NAD(P)/FAD-dependent oxidoreductase [Pseudorhodoferax sp. Leaf267]KQP13527.1 flavocytochrome C [Pseudorhodoferax sp. Leaf267]